MQNSTQRSRACPVYPLIASEADFGIVRIAGAGLGNSLLTYFEAFLYAAATGRELIQPAWPSIKIGPLLRGDRSNRFYGGFFRRGAGEITGLKKALLLSKRLSGRWQVHRLGGTAEVASNGRIAVVRNTKYGFENLLPHRDIVRHRFAEIIAEPDIIQHSWGSAPYIAVHVRLGDFAPATENALTVATSNNLRIPIEWYRQVIVSITTMYPTVPILIFSDGTEEELSALTELPNVRVQREKNDLAELIALASCRLLIGSRSTFSYWAAFLGDMPAIWFETNQVPERLSTSPEHQILVSKDFTSFQSRIKGLF